MIPFFAGLALLIWWPACVWRRQWRGVGAVVLGAALLMGIIVLHIKIGQLTHGQIFVPVFQSIMIPYAVLVVGMAIFIVALPRNHPDGHCAACGYDIRGLAQHAGQCPECAGAITPAVDPQTATLQPTVVLALAPDQPPHQSQQQDHQRDTGEQSPEDRGLLTA